MIFERMIMSSTKGQVKQFTDALETMLLKMKEVDNTCIEVSKDISQREFGLVVALGKEKSLIMSEIADLIMVPMSTATGIVDKLVSKGYLMRFYSEEDRRIVRIGLSKYGSELFELLEKMMTKFGYHILEGFEDTEKEQFIYLLQKATRNLDFQLKSGAIS